MERGEWRHHWGSPPDMAESQSRNNLFKVVNLFHHGLFDARDMHVDEDDIFTDDGQARKVTLLGNHFHETLLQTLC